ncbi:serine/threonine-protein phosphatase 6 regulatory ankyrin repeat subunit C [Episyrphus balteatus]|uniref:serine/threonine-protein phosphatase 6 regulatory ankyrin repeat subunit C n=1 Tax=Episyrphus balteatus TaxID=286459 RepID=UPI002486B197|nr:serine/threonine-protein phosphatase 6 regulatory ankyrin repeat subunit C [Episyrphus balteatus]
MLCLENPQVFNAQVSNQTVTSITLQWDKVPNSDIYEIEKYTKKFGWQRVSWTSACRTTIEQLDDNFAYRFHIKALKLSPNGNQDCDEEEESFDEHQPKEFITLGLSEEIVGMTLSSPPSTMCLHRAIKKGQQFLIKRILRRRPSLIDYPAQNGYLPLANAITMGEICIIDIILTAGASVHTGNPLNGRTPLHLAFFYGHLPVARILLNKKADINVKDNNGVTPCHCAVDANQYDILKFALDNGADMEAMDMSGWTLLLRAVGMHSDLMIVKLLHQQGSKLGALDVNGLNCMELARLFGNNEALKYLENCV